MARKHFNLTRLPVMPQTAHRIRALLRDPRSTNADIEHVLLFDPGATLALYQTVELRRPGSVDELSGPAHALSMTGREAFRQAFEQLPEIDGPHAPPASSPAFAYSQAAHAGWYAHAIAHALGLGNPIEMQVAALLQHPAVLALWVRHFDAAVRASNAMREGVPFDTAFSTELGAPLDKADLRLTATWRLPCLAREAATDGAPINPRAQSILQATRMAEIAFAGWPSEECEAQAELLSELLPGHHRDPLNWWHQLTAEAARELQAFDFPLPARELLWLPPDQPGAARPTPPTSSETLPEDQKKPGTQALLEDALRQLIRDTGTHRVVFAMLTRNHQRLRTRLALGGPKDSPWRTLDLPVREKHLFSLLLSRRQAAWVRPEDNGKYAPYLRAIPLDEQSAGGFYTTSLIINDKPLGILYADGGAMDKPGYARFRHHASEIIRVLESRQSRAA